MKRYLYLGTKTMSFSQKRDGEAVTITGDGLERVSLSPEDANALWKGKRSIGWRTEKPSFSPERPKTRGEALSSRYGSLEERKDYVEAKKAFRRFYLNKGLHYGGDLDKAVKNALNKWEEAGRPAYSC